MGQKLEKLEEQAEESCEDSSAQTEQSDSAEEDEKHHDQDDGSFTSPRSTGGISGISVGSPVTGELTVTSARTDPQTGQPISPLGQQEHRLNARREWVGGDREGVTRTVEESKTVLRLKETRQTLNNKRRSENKAVACFGTTAMEEQGNQKKSEADHSKLCPQTRGVTASRNPTSEEDFVVLEKDESWTSSDGGNNIVFGDRIKTEKPRSSITRGVEEDASDAYNTLQQISRSTPQEKGTDKKSRRKSDTPLAATDSVDAHARSSPNACFEKEMGQHLAEVTGSRCQLKEGSRVGAAHSETTGGVKVEREQTLNDQSKQQHLSTRNKSENQDKESQSSGFLKQTDQSYQSKFAGVVSKRVKEGVTAALCSSTKKDDSQAFDSHPPKAMTPHSVIPQPQDNSSFSLEQCDLIPYPPLPGNEGCDGKQVASLKRESELVCFSVVITPPPLTHVLPKKDTTMATQLDTSMVHSPAAPDTTSAASTSKDDESVPKEKPKVKGPPPPVPKKPKNPFIRLKTAQLMSTDVQRRDKDHLRSEERVKRRHTFHFNQSLPRNPPKNQDMCLLWDERGTYAMPMDFRRQSADLSLWDHLSLDYMDERYGDMIDFDYCVRMAKPSPDQETENLDMLQRRVFQERRSRRKWSPPTVAKKPQSPLASTETQHIPEVTSDNETERPKPARSEKREIQPELRSERIRTQVGDDSHTGYRNFKEITEQRRERDAGNDSEVGSYKPVLEIVKETNQMQKHQGRIKPEGAKAQVRVAEQSPSVKVSQMKNAFDVPKKSKERPAELQPSPKKGGCFGLSALRYNTSVL